MPQGKSSSMGPSMAASNLEIDTKSVVSKSDNQLSIEQAMEEMGCGFKWLFKDCDLNGTPSTRSGITVAQEQTFRAKIALLIQVIGAKSRLTQLAMNTAVIFMHRFFMYRHVKQFPRLHLAIGFAFAGGKVEESFCKLEHLIRSAIEMIRSNKNREFLDKSDPLTYEMDCQWRNKLEALLHSNCSTDSTAYQDMRKIILECEAEIYAVIGFNLSIVHPHNYVVRMCRVLGAENIKDISHYAYNLATASSQLTMLCLKYKPEMIAIMCLHVASRAHNVDFLSLENKGNKWYQSFDSAIEINDVELVSREFLHLAKGYNHWKDAHGQQVFQLRRIMPGPSAGLRPSGSNPVQPGARQQQHPAIMPAAAPQPNLPGTPQPIHLAAATTSATTGRSAAPHPHHGTPHQPQQQRAVPASLNSSISAPEAVVKNYSQSLDNNNRKSIPQAGVSGDLRDRNGFLIVNPSIEQLPVVSRSSHHHHHHQHSHSIAHSQHQRNVHIPPQQQPQSLHYSQQNQLHHHHQQRPVTSLPYNASLTAPITHQSSTPSSTITHFEQGSRQQNSRQTQLLSSTNPHVTVEAPDHNLVLPPSASSSSTLPVASATLEMQRNIQQQHPMHQRHSGRSLNDLHRQNVSRSQRDLLKVEQNSTTRMNPETLHPLPSAPGHDQSRISESAKKVQRSSSSAIPSMPHKQQLHPHQLMHQHQQQHMMTMREQDKCRLAGELSPHTPPLPYSNNNKATSKTPVASVTSAKIPPNSGDASQPCVSLSRSSHLVAGYQNPVVVLTPVDAGGTRHVPARGSKSQPDILNLPHQNLSAAEPTLSPIVGRLPSETNGQLDDKSSLVKFTKPQDSPGNSSLKIKVKREQSSSERVKYADGLKIKIKPLKPDGESSLDSVAGPSEAGQPWKTNSPMVDGQIENLSSPASSTGSSRKSEGLRIKLSLPKAIEPGNATPADHGDHDNANGLGGERESSSHRSHHHSHHHRSHHKSKKHSKHSRHEGGKSSKRSSSNDSSAVEDQRPAKMSRSETFTSSTSGLVGGAYGSSNLSLSLQPGGYPGLSTSSSSLASAASDSFQQGFSINDAFSTTMPTDIFDDDDEDTLPSIPLTPVDSYTGESSALSHHEKFQQMMNRQIAKRGSHTNPTPPPS